MIWIRTYRLLSICVVLILSPGCFRSDPSNRPQPKATGTSEKKEEGHDHSGWWCAEHGVPEEVCTRCDKSLIPKYKKKGDWCEDHTRPKSQCFLCDPTLKEKFAKQYREKNDGKEPPAITEP